MKAGVRRELANRKRRIDRRIRNKPGIGAIHLPARKLGLINGIDERLHVLKRHPPYHGSDHVLAIAYDLPAGGSRIEHLEVRRDDEVYLDAPGAGRIADPTTAGDSCRRFTEADAGRLMDAFNDTRLRAWAEQTAGFLDHACIDADGTLAPTSGWCERGVGIAYDGAWGYHPLVVPLAKAAGPRLLANRSGNRPSHEGAHLYLGKAITPRRRGGLKRVTLRGDTGFTRAEHLGRWDGDGVGSLFGIDARANLVALAGRLPPDAYALLERPPRSPARTSPRSAREGHRTPIAVARQLETIRSLGEEVAEFDYRPLACETTYRVVALRKELARDRGQMRLLEEDRSFSWITNDRATGASGLVLLANGRRDRENLIAQLKGGVKALAMPVGDLTSDRACMVMASPAWSPRAWSALVLPEGGRWAGKYRAERRSLLRMEFSSFRVAMIQVPCQAVKAGRRIVCRLPAWSPWRGAFLGLVERPHGRRLCRSMGR